ARALEIRDRNVARAGPPIGSSRVDPRAELFHGVLGGALEAPSRREILVRDGPQRESPSQGRFLEGAKVVLGLSEPRFVYVDLLSAELAPFLSALHGRLEGLLDQDVPDEAGQLA